MKDKNLIVILSDQFNPKVIDFPGATPNLSALSKRGVTFTNAYSNSPLCCPARAALATGKYVHKIGSWDNAFPYNGSIPSWGHILRENGVRIDAVGKLHFRSEKDDNGFSREHNTMHTVEGIGDVVGCLRDDTSIFDKRSGVLDAGIGTSSYVSYDWENTRFVADWITRKKNDETRWALFLGIALPHPPNKIPQKYFDRFRDKHLPFPPMWGEDERSTEPAIDYVRRFFGFDEPFTEEQVANFLAAYYGACAYVDELVGLVLDSLERSSLTEKTDVIFCSDHGETMGARGVFGKFSLYDESIKIPLICAGPSFPKGRVITNPVSLVDLYPTILDLFAIEGSLERDGVDGISLLKLAEEKGGIERCVFAEYYGPGSRSAEFMLRRGNHKFIYHAGGREQLFDLERDPDEADDLAGKGGHEKLLESFRAELFRMLDPESLDAEVKRQQKILVDRAGGAAMVKGRGTFDNTPIPGEDAVFFRRE